MRLGRQQLRGTLLRSMIWSSSASRQHPATSSSSSPTSLTSNMWVFFPQLNPSSFWERSWWRTTTAASPSPSPRTTTRSCFNPSALTTRPATAFQHQWSNDLLWIQHRLWPKNNIINIDNLLNNCFGSVLFDQIFNMQHETLANIWLLQHNLIFSNSNIVFITSKVLNTNQLLLQPQLPAGFHLPPSIRSTHPIAHRMLQRLRLGRRLSTTRQSTSGSLVTILKTNMHSSSKTQQVIATSSAEAELYAISTTVADAIHLKQLITEIENNIGVATVRLRQASTKHCSFLRFIFCNKFGSKDGNQQANKTYSTLLFVDSGFASEWASSSSSWFQQKTTQLMHSPNHWQLLLCNDIFQQLAFKPMLPTKRGEYNNIFFVVDNFKKKNNNKQRQAALCQQLRPQQALQVVQLTSAATTGLQQQRSGQQISILQLSGGTSPTTTIDNQQQVDQQQLADSNVQQQQQQEQQSY